MLPLQTFKKINIFFYFMKKLSLIICGVILIIGNGFSQDTATSYGQHYTRNTITTAVPFVGIGPDARSGGMGELGAGTEPDAASMHWNPSKYAFINKDLGFSVSYSPWLANLVSDINLAYLSGYKRIDGRSTVAATLKYFSLGEIAFTDENGGSLGNYRPSEFSIDAAYARKFSDKISGSVAGRFIYSNLTQGQVVSGQTTKPGTTGAADVSFFYTDDLSIGWLESSKINFGIDISNIGAKVSYSNDDTYKDFIPTNLRLGPSWLMNIDEFNSFRFSIDLNKLLVPTPPIYATDSSGSPIYGQDGKLTVFSGKNNDVNVAQGMIQSFYDAPGGFSEEMKEIIWIVGAEYWYAKQFSVRGGYFHESVMKGGRQFFTLGVGLRYNVFGLDFSYLIPTEQQNPLANTLRFTLTFDFEGFKNQN
jgi:hypothetical protein